MCKYHITNFAANVIEFKYMISGLLELNLIL
jgi:hypothetical protein